MKLSERTEKTEDFTADDLFHLVSAGASWKVKTGVFFNNGLEASATGAGLGGTLTRDTTIQADAFAFRLQGQTVNDFWGYNESFALGGIYHSGDINGTVNHTIDNINNGASASSSIGAGGSGGSVRLTGYAAGFIQTNNYNYAGSSVLSFTGVRSSVFYGANKPHTFWASSADVTKNSMTLYNERVGVGDWASTYADIKSTLHLKGTLSIDNIVEGTNTDYSITNANYYYSDVVSGTNKIIDLADIGTVGKGKIFVIRNHFDSTASMIITCPADHGFDDATTGETTFELRPNQTITITAESYSDPNGVYSIVSNFGTSGVFAQADTGCLTFAGLTPNSGTTIDIGAVTGSIADNETTPSSPEYTSVNYAGATNVTVTTLGSGQSTYVMLGMVGPIPTISFQNTFPTSKERKENIFLGKVGHPAGVITTVINEPDYITSPMAFSRDLFQALGPYINDNVVPYANGANLNVNISAGNIHGNGINFAGGTANRQSPNEISTGPIAILSYLPRTQTGAGGAAITTVDVGNYEVAGVVTAIPGAAARSTIRYFYAVPTSAGVGYIATYGQQFYDTLSDAIAAVGRETRIVYPNLIGNAILIGVLVARKDATQLNNLTQAQFFPADKLGQLAGATAGITVGTMQTAYNNSSVPQVSVTDTLGAVTWRSARASNTSSISEWQNIAGTTVASINGNGLFSASSLNLTTALAAIYGGTGQSTYVLGDILISSATNVLTRLAGNTTTARQFLTSTGSGGLATAPAYFSLFATANTWTAAQTITMTDAATGGFIAQLTNSTGEAGYSVKNSSGTIMGGLYYQGTGGGSYPNRVQLYISESGGSSLEITTNSQSVANFTSSAITLRKATTIQTSLTLTDINVILSTTTGTKFGTSATQKLSFWNATPIVQPANTTAINDVLINTGLMASGGSSLFTSDLKLTTLGTGIYVKEGANATMGTGTLVLGQATISTTKVTANSRIFISEKATGGSAQFGVVREVKGSRVVGTSLLVAAYNAGTVTINTLDTSDFDWIIIEPS